MWCADEDWDHLDWSKAPAIQEMPVTSAILAPAPGSTVSAEAGKVTVSGYALAGGGREIIRVDVSADDGKTWRAAKLLPVPEGMEQGYRKNWAWRHWEVPPFCAWPCCCALVDVCVVRVCFITTADASLCSGVAAAACHKRTQSVHVLSNGCHDSCHDSVSCLPGFARRCSRLRGEGHALTGWDCRLRCPCKGKATSSSSARRLTTLTMRNRRRLDRFTTPEALSPMRGIE